MDIHTRRWSGVPFCLRAGKRLGRRVTEIAVVFKRAPNLLFRDHSDDDFGQNAVVIRVQPDEGVTIRFRAWASFPRPGERRPRLTKRTSATLQILLMPHVRSGSWPCSKGSVSFPPSGKAVELPLSDV